MTQPSQDQILTASLKLVVDAFVNLGYEEDIIFGKVNLILNKFITPEGDFTEEYIKLAKVAIETRESSAFKASLEIDPQRPLDVNIILSGGIGL